MRTQQAAAPGDGPDGASDVTIVDVRFEHYRDTRGVGESRPRWSWLIDTTVAGWCQVSYEIEA
jgi:alpha-L-rhamnosidase